MKKLFPMSKSNILIVGLASLTLASCICLTCFALKDNRGQDGANGKDASIAISDNGEVIINDSRTGICANKADCNVNLNVEGNEFGRVVGGGKFSLKETIAVEAIPNENACFKGWKDDANNIVSTNSIYTFPAIKGDINLTAVFEKSLIEVYFRVPFIVEQYFDYDFAIEANGERQDLVASNGCYVFKAPLIFGYGETVSLEFKNFIPSTSRYHCYLYEEDKQTYLGTGLNRISHEITDSLSYSFTINENRPYYFCFDIEVSYIIEILPTINVTSNNEEYGYVSKTEITSKGDLITITATPKDSLTTDYIHSFKGWYLNNELVCKNNVYVFKANENQYDFEAVFVKKYSLKFQIKILDKGSNVAGLDPTSYLVSYKSVKVNSFDIEGNLSSIEFNGNYNGQTPDLSTKICGYFEINEKIFLSNEIESSHQSYYVTDRDGERTYKEKFVYSRWILKQDSYSQSLATGSSAVFFINEDMDLSKLVINVELFVVHYGDKVGD